MKHLKYVVPFAIVVGGLLLNTTVSLGNAKFAKETGKKCTYCHVDPKTPKNLTDAGKYYKEHKSLDGYKEPAK